MKPEDLKAGVQDAAELLRLLDRFFPDRIDAETVRLLDELATNDLAVAALFKGTEFLKLAEGKAPRR
jgi:hypothetical protein